MYGTKTARRSSAGERHFVQVQFAQQDCAGGLQPPGDFRVFSRHAVLENLSCRGGPYASGVDVVFERERDAVQPAGNASGLSLPVAFARLLQSGTRIEGDERI